MPARVTVYCRKSVIRVTAGEILAGLDRLDWHTIAEGYDIEDDEIFNRALSFFRIEGENGYFTLHCRPPELRQLEISIVEDSKAHEWIEEQIEELGSKFDRVAMHLQESIEVVNIETGYFQFVEMMPVFASEVAMWFATIGDGYILSDDGEWWKIDGYNFVKID